MAKPIPEIDFAPQALHIRDGSSLNEGGNTRTVTKATFMKGMAEGGITREILEAVATEEGRFMSAAIDTTVVDLEDRIKLAREAGNDASRFTQRTNIATVSGKLTIDVAAKRTYPNRKPGQPADPSLEPIVKYGSVRVTTESDRQVSPHVVKTARDRIAIALGINAPQEE